MRMLALCSALVGAALFSGCVATNVPPPDRRVTIAPDLGTSVYVTDVRCVKGPTGIYTFQANVVNNTGSDRAVQWKVVWLDADGVTMFCDEMILVKSDKPSTLRTDTTEP